MGSQVYIPAQELIGVARSLDVVSSASQWRALMDSADNLLKASVNGGAWTPFVFAAGGVVSMQNAYDGGGALGTGLGRTLATMAGGAVVFTDSAANANNVLELNKTPAAGQLGSALSVTMNVNATFGPGIAVSIAAAACVGQTITMGVAANSTAYNAVMNGTGAALSVLRTQPAVGAGVAAINYADQAAAASGARNQPAFLSRTNTNFTANGSYAVAHNRFVLDPSSQGGGTTLTLNRAIVSVEHAPTIIAGGLYADTTTGISVSMVPAAASVVNGIVVTQDIIVSTGSAYTATVNNIDGTGYTATLAHTGASAAIGFAYNRTIAPVAAVVARPTALNVNNTPGGAAAYTEAAVLISITHTSHAAVTADSSQAIFVSMAPAAANQPVTGALIRMGANAGTAGFAAQFDWRGTAGTKAAATSLNAVATINAGAATVLTGALTGLTIDLANYSGNQTLIGALVNVPATTAADVATTATAAGATNVIGAGALVIFSRATLQRVVDVVTQNTAGSIALVRYPTGLNTTLTAALTGLTLDLATNVLPAAQNVTGIDLTVPANANASNATRGATFTRSGTAITANQTWTGNLINLQNTPTGGGGGVVLTENGVLLNVNHAPVAGATAMVDTTTAIRATLAPSTANSTGLRAIDLIFAANVTGSTALANMAFSGVGGASVLSAPLTMLNIDASTNVTGGVTEASGIKILIPATTRASTALEGALTIDSQATLARIIDCAVANTGAATGLWVLRWRAATTLTAATTLLRLDGGTNVLPAAQSLTGISVTVPANQSGANTTTGQTITRSGTLVANYAWTGTILNLQNTPTAGGGGTTLTESSAGLLTINHAPAAGAGAITDTTTGIAVTITPVASGAPTVTGISVTMGVNTTTTGGAIRATTASPTITSLVALTNTSATTIAGSNNSGYVLDARRTGSWSGGGVVVGELAVMTDRSTVTASATWGRSVLQVIHAPTASGAGVTYTMGGSVFDLRHAPVAPVGGAAYTDTTAVLVLECTPQASGTPACVGINITMGVNNTGADAANSASLVIQHNAPNQRAIHVNTQQTQGKAVQIDYAAGAKTLTAAMTGLLINVSSNVTLNGFVANAITAIVKDQTTPLWITQEASGPTTVQWFIGTGAPNNANGANNDFYFRADGGAGAVIYQKRAGAWVATGA